MEAILSFTMMGVFSESLPQWEKVQVAIDSFLEGAPNVALISDDPGSWNDIKFSKPTEIRNIGNDTNEKVNAKAFILDFRGKDWDPETLRHLQRNADSKYVILTTEEKAESVSSAVITAGLCNVLLISVQKNETKVAELLDPCRGIGGFPEKGHFCKANVSFFDYPPDIVFTGQRLLGTEGLMVQTVADHLGIELHYINRHEIEFGEFDPPSGLNGDVASGRSIAGLGVLYATHARYVYVDFAFGCGYTQWAWAVPVHAAPRSPTWFVILVSEFSPNVWLGVLLVYLVLLPVTIIFKWKSKWRAPWPFHLLALLLGVPQQILLQRGLSLAIIIFGFLITAHYQAMMGSKLTAPAKIPEITTLKQLAESGLELLGPGVIGMILNVSATAFPEDKTKYALSASYVPTGKGLDELLPRIVERRDIAYHRHRNFVYSHAQKDPRTAGHIHMVEEPSLEFLPATLIPKHSCLGRKIQESYHRLCDSGLGSKWIQDSVPKDTPIMQIGPRKLAIEHIQGFLYLLLFGWVISFTTFVVEMGTCKSVKFVSYKEKLKNRGKLKREPALFIQTRNLPTTEKSILTRYEETYKRKLFQAPPNGIRTVWLN